MPERAWDVKKMDIKKMNMKRIFNKTTKAQNHKITLQIDKYKSMGLFYIRKIYSSKNIPAFDKNIILSEYDIAKIVEITKDVKA